jgi:hypothetical protein
MFSSSALADRSFRHHRLVLYYPFTALSTIFFYVLSSPLEESTPNDIALMETIVGFLGRVEYITSGGSAFTNTREFVRQARLFVATRRRSTDTTISPGLGTAEFVARENSSGAADDDDRIRMQDSAFVDSTVLEAPGPGDLFPGRVAGDQLLAPSAYCNLEGGDELPRSFYADVLGVLSPSAEFSSNQWIGTWVPADIQG